MSSKERRRRGSLQLPFTSHDLRGFASPLSIEEKGSLSTFGRWFPSFVSRSDSLGRKSGDPVSSMQAQSPKIVWGDSPSSWSGSGLKRGFDCLCVFCSLPVLVPLVLVMGLAVRLTSAGPVLFLQKRVGRHGRPFTILKFRTMEHDHKVPPQVITTAGNQRFTSIGLFLRRWKLDELPQLWNVLIGEMSLVGPRPKLPELEPCCLPCRPGVTGAATLIFARQEMELDRIPQNALNGFYSGVVLPAKRKLDVQYMAQATFRSDLELLFDTVLLRWDTSVMKSLLRQECQTALPEELPVA